MRFLVHTISHYSIANIISLWDSLSKDPFFMEHGSLVILDNSCDKDEHETLKQFAYAQHVKPQVTNCIHVMQAQHNLLYTEGNNYMLSFAITNNPAWSKDADVIIIMNPDITFDESIFERIYNRLMNDQSIGALGIKLMYPKSNIIEHAGCINNRHIGFGEKDGPEFNKEKEVEWVTGAFLAIRKNIIKKVGYLDRTFPHWGSDQEFCRRIKHFGYKVWYLPSKAYHNQGHSSAEHERHYGTTKNIKPGVFPNFIPLDPQWYIDKAYYNYLTQSLMHTNPEDFTKQKQAADELFANTYNRRQHQ